MWWDNIINWLSTVILFGLEIETSGDSWAWGSVETNAADKEALVVAAVKKIDQAAAKGLIHKNNAAHKKSALVTKLNKSNA